MYLRPVYILLITLFAFHNVSAAAIATERKNAHSIPKIAIIIDDMGYDRQNGQRAIALPGQITLAFIAASTYVAGLASDAHRRHKEVMLHLAMQPTKDSNQLEYNAVTLDMNDDDIGRVLWESLASVPYAVGLNNHMGSLITQHPGHMQWLMEWLSGTGLYFVDSVTSAKSVALDVAKENQIPSIARDIFLDHVRNGDEINRQFDRLLSLARSKGIALAIGHPYPETLSVLERRLRQLPNLGIQLVPVSHLIRL